MGSLLTCEQIVGKLVCQEMETGNGCWRGADSVSLEHYAKKPAFFVCCFAFSVSNEAGGRRQ